MMFSELNRKDTLQDWGKKCYYESWAKLLNLKSEESLANFDKSALKLGMQSVTVK